VLSKAEAQNERLVRELELQRETYVRNAQSLEQSVVPLNAVRIQPE
jgi:hypothetical protein